MDESVWIHSKDGAFSVLMDDAHPDGPLAHIWKLKIPSKVTMFAWLVVRGSILTMDNLRHQNMIMVNTCPMCLCVEESIDHLLLGCEVAREMLFAFLNLFGCHWVLPNRLFELFLAWRFVTG